MLNRRKFAVSTGLGLLASPMLMTRHAMAAEFNFKYGGTVSAEHPLMKNVARAAERIRIATGGRVDFQVFPSGQRSCSSPPIDLEYAARCMMRLDVTGMVGIQGWGDAAS